MLRRVIGAVVIAVVIAIPFAWSAYRKYEVARLVDQPPDVTIRAEDWRIFYDRFIESSVWTGLLESEAFTDVLQSPEGRDFADLRNGLEVVLDEDPAQLFLRTFGHRLDGGIWLRPSGGFAMGLISVPQAGTDLSDVADRLNVMSKSSPQEPSYEVEGMTVFPLGNGGVLVFADKVAALASAEALGIALVRSWGERVRAQEAGEPGIHVAIGPAMYGGDFEDPEFEDALQTFGSIIVFGGITKVLDEAENLALDVVPVEDGIRAQLRFDVGRDALGSAGGGYVPTLPAETPLGEAEMLRFELSRDFARFWDERAVHLPQAALAQLERDDAQSDMPGLTQAIFEGLEPTLTVRVVNEGGARGLAPVPAIAAEARMRDASLAPKLVQVLEAGVERANASSTDGTRLELGEASSENGSHVRRIGLESPALADAGPVLRERLDPAWAHDGSQIVLSSSVQLARELLAAPRPPNLAADAPASDRLRVRAEPLRIAMETHLPVLAEMQMAERRIDRKQAVRELQGLTKILEGLDDARLELAHGETETVLSLTLRGR